MMDTASVQMIIGVLAYVSVTAIIFLLAYGLLVFLFAWSHYDKGYSWCEAIGKARKELR